MNKEQAINEIKYAKSFGTSGIVPRWEAIDTILDYIADLEKENAVKESNFKIVSKYNEELENKLKIQTQNYHSAHEDINWFCDKYIPKQKVRDKIEELENLIKEAHKELGSASKEFTIYVSQEKILKELLEEEI